MVQAEKLAITVSAHSYRNSHAPRHIGCTAQSFSSWSDA